MGRDSIFSIQRSQLLLSHVDAPHHWSTDTIVTWDVLFDLVTPTEDVKATLSLENTVAGWNATRRAPIKQFTRLHIYWESWPIRPRRATLKDWNKPLAASDPRELAPAGLPLQSSKYTSAPSE